MFTVIAASLPGLHEWVLQETGQRPGASTAQFITKEILSEDCDSMGGYWAESALEDRG
jgi:hypothetical protein